MKNKSLISKILLCSILLMRLLYVQLSDFSTFQRLYDLTSKLIRMIRNHHMRAVLKSHGVELRMNMPE